MKQSAKSDPIAEVLKHDEMLGDILRLAEALRVMLAGNALGCAYAVRVTDRGGLQVAGFGRDWYATRAQLAPVWGISTGAKQVARHASVEAVVAWFADAIADELRQLAKIGEAA